jgi:hypothetical protein
VRLTRHSFPTTDCTYFAVIYSYLQYALVGAYGRVHTELQVSTVNDDKVLVTVRICL